MQWQIHGAQGELDDVVARSIEDGPLTLVREGTEVAVIVSISDYRKLTIRCEAVSDQADANNVPDLRDFLLSRSDLFTDDFAEIMDRIVRDRANDLPRDIEL